MVDTIRTKQVLLTLFADNTTGDITPQDLRDFVVSNLVQETETTTGDGIVGADVDRVIAQAGTGVLSLPSAFDYGLREMHIYNTSGGTITISGDFDTGLSIAIDNGKAAILVSNPSTNEWLTLINSSDVDIIDHFVELLDVPSDYTGQANKHVAVNVGEDGLEFVDLPALPANAYGAASWNGNALATNVIDGVPVQVAGAMISTGLENDFIVSVGSLHYIGTATKVFQYTASLSVSKLLGGDALFKVTLGVNGSPATPPIVDSYESKYDNSVICGVLLLSQNDVLHPFIEGVGTSDDLTVSDLNIVLTEIRQ